MRRLSSWALTLSAVAAATLLLRAPRATQTAAAGLAPIGGTYHPIALSPEMPRAPASPWRIPWSGWKAILWRTYHEVDDDRLLAVSGGVVFFVLLAIFPTITTFVSIYGIFSSPLTVAEDLQPLMMVVPADAGHFLIGEVQRIAAKSTQALSLATGLSLAIALWSANAGTKSLLDALNVAYGERERRGFVRLNVVSFAFTLGLIAFLTLAALSVIVLPLALSYLGLSGLSEALWPMLRWPILFVIAAGGISILYRYGPSRGDARWRWLTVGSLVATVLWLGASLLFAWYLGQFADYNGTYGSLGAVVGLLMWLWLSVTAVLLGAELDAEIERHLDPGAEVGDPAAPEPADLLQPEPAERAAR